MPGLSTGLTGFDWAVVFFTRQDDPGDAGHFVGQGNRYLVGMFARQQRLYPGLAPRQAGLSPTPDMTDYRLCPLHQ